jgi:hypothetical protein
MSGWEEKYKNASKTAEAVLLLVNASIEIITPIFASQVAHVNSLINLSNIEALKKRHPVLTDDFREYSALLTSLNTMSSNVSRMEYTRKSLALLVSGKSKFDDKSRAHINNKVEKFESDLADFAASAKVSTHAIEFFGSHERGTRDRGAQNEKDDAGTGKQVSSLKELAKKLASIIDNIEERSISDVRMAGKDVQRIIGKGNTITGSAGYTDEREHEVKVGGFTDGEDAQVFMGGGHSVIGAESRRRKYDRLRKDLHSGEYGIYGSAEEYGKNVVTPTMSKLYAGKSPKDLASMDAVELASYFRELDNITESVEEQLRAARESYILQNLRGYLAKHHKQYLEEDISPIKLPDTPDIESANPETLASIHIFLEAMDVTLSTTDRSILKSYVDRVIQSAADPEEKQKIMESIESYKRDEGPPVRIVVKRELRKATHAYADALKTLQSAQDATNTRAREVYEEVMKSDASALPADKLIKFNEGIKEMLSMEERAYVAVADALQSLLSQWNAFISPERVDTCIRRVISYVAYPRILRESEDDSAEHAELYEKIKLSDADKKALKEL